MVSVNLERKTAASVLFAGTLILFVSSGCATMTGRTAIIPTPQSCTNIDQIDDQKPIELNRDFRRRDQLLGLTVEWGKNDIGGMMPFDRASLSTVMQLYNERFLDPSDRQNLAPSAGQLLVFMCRYPAALASGYVIGPDRDDYRVTIDAIDIPSWAVTSGLKADLGVLCRDADEVHTFGDLYCWWD